MSKAARYRFFVHREQAPYRLVLRDGDCFPEGTAESEWRLTRIREEDDVNSDVRDEVAAKGYCLFAIGLALDMFKR